MADKIHELESGTLYNFALSLKFDAKGRVRDLADFKKRLVTTLKAPISIADFDLGKHQEDIRAIRVFVLLDEKRNPTKASFRKLPGALAYVAKETGSEVHLGGKPKLTGDQEDEVFCLLSKEASKAGPFDALGAAGKKLEAVVNKVRPGLLKRK